MKNLTNQTRKDFLNWLIEEQSVSLYGFDLGSEIVKNAFIVAFFDSAGIYLNIFEKKKTFCYSVKELSSGFIFDSRNEAIADFIKVSNSIYNKKHEKSTTNNVLLS